MPARTHEQVRYPDSVDPVTTDGRGIDTGVAILTGEAASQEIKGQPEKAQKLTPKPWTQIPSIDEQSPTYYDRPLLKESVWSIDIPLYYYFGGAAGAALALGAAVQLTSGQAGKKRLRRFARDCHWTGVAGSTLGAAFLIHDLGRPARFVYMLRVFRPSSPMNIGAWILAGAAPTAISTAVLINRSGLPGWIGEGTGYASGIFGAALATYTGVLVSNSSIPIWQESRRWMPLLFGASAMASAGAILHLLPQSRAAERAVAIYGTIGRIGELAIGRQVERSASAMQSKASPKGSVLLPR